MRCRAALVPLSGASRRNNPRSREIASHTTSPLILSLHEMQGRPRPSLRKVLQPFLEIRMNRPRAYPHAFKLALVAFAGTLAQVPVVLATDGHFLHGVGTVNQSMGGAGTAAILDPLGMVKWNPAGSTQFEGTQIELNFEFFMPDRRIASDVSAGAFGPGFPPVDLSGSTDSESNPSFMPSIAIVHRSADSDFAFHGGMLSVAGFGVEYPMDPSNPVVTPQPPNGMGFGAIKSNLGMMLFPVGMSYQANDKLSVGFSLVPAASSLEIAPAPFAAPDDANGDGFPSYPRPQETEWSYGIGGQIGVHYQATERLQLGASLATPVWFTKHEYTVADELGNDRDVACGMDLPLHVSFGAAYQLTPTTLLASDVRWFNYSATRGFRGSGYRPDGSVAGFGWNDIWCIGVGIQQDIGEKVKVRLGYNFGQNPIPEDLTFFSSCSPALVQHHISMGLSYEIDDHWTIHAGYYHAFKNSQTGPFQSGSGPIPGANVTSELEEDSVALGVTFKF